MRLSKTVEQACCILAIIAEHHGQPVTNTELNKRMAVSQSYLMKITRKLVVADIINSTQGVNGGFSLARPMSSITLKSVVQAIEGDTPFFQPTELFRTAFPSREYLTNKGVALLSKSFTEAEHAWFALLDTTTMQQLISDVKEQL